MNTPTETITTRLHKLNKLITKRICAEDFAVHAHAAYIAATVSALTAIASVEPSTRLEWIERAERLAPTMDLVKAFQCGLADYLWPHDAPKATSEGTLRVYDFVTDEKLEGAPSGALIEASESAGNGAVHARKIDGIWTFVDAADVGTLRASKPAPQILAVYVANYFGS